jgi:hypothetical protein
MIDYLVANHHYLQSVQDSALLMISLVFQNFY